MQWRLAAGAVALAVIVFFAVTLTERGLASLTRHESTHAGQPSQPVLRPESGIASSDTSRESPSVTPPVAPPDAVPEARPIEPGSPPAVTGNAAEPSVGAVSEPTGGAVTERTERAVEPDEQRRVASAPGSTSIGAREQLSAYVATEQIPPSIAAPARSPSTIPLAPVARLDVTPTSSEIRVRWAPPPGGGLDLVYEVRRGVSVISRGSETGTIERNLRPGQQYCYTVQAFDGWGRQSQVAGPACAVDPQPPTPPANVAVVAASDTRVDIRWLAATDNAGVAGYEVQRDSTAAVYVEHPSFSSGGLKPDTQYCFTVTALDLVGNRSAPAGPSCVRTPDVKAPTAPSHLAVVPRPPATLVVAWDEATDDVGVAGYDVLRDGVAVAQVGGTSLTQGGLKVGVKYCFTVRAFDKAGNRSQAAGPTCETLPDLEAPTAPGEPLAVGSAATRVELGWLASQDNVAVASYEVLSDGKLVANVTGLRFMHSGLLPERQYCYVVRAVDPSGNRSPQAGTFCATTAREGALGAPSMVRAVSVSADGVSLVWEPTEARDVVYRIYGRSKFKKDRPATIGMTSGKAFTDEGIPGGVPRCYSVAAVDPNGRESPRSLETCATAPASQLGAAAPQSSAKPN